MATPPTRAVFATPAVGYLSTTTPKTTPTFDVVLGDLLVVIGSSENYTYTLTTPTTTGNVTWTLQQSLTPVNYCAMYVWTGVVNATATGITVTVDESPTTGGQFSFGASLWRNHGGVGASAKTNASGAPSLAITCSANSAVACGSDDWAAIDGTTRTWRTVNVAAMTESLYARNSATYTVYSAYRLDTGAAATQTLGLTAPVGQTYAIVGVEVLGTAGAAPQMVALLTPTPYYRN